jgi:hypothetical protein
MENNGQQAKTTKDGVEIYLRSLPVPQKIFFYERQDGSVIDSDERFAAKIHNKYRQWGVSDGKHYFEKMKDLQGRINALTLEEYQAGLRQAWQEEIDGAKGKYENPVLKPLNMGMKEQIFPGRDTI